MTIRVVSIMWGLSSKSSTLRRRFQQSSALTGAVLALSCFVPASSPGDDGAGAPAGKSPPAAATGAGVSLFNGKDLSGWEGAPGWWTVENGALTSQSTPEKPCTACNYLVWKGGQPSDFELTCDFKLSPAANSGIQIRSETRPNWDTYGYQADMTGDGGLVGYVYHHKRGLIAGRGDQVTIDANGEKKVEKIGDPVELLKSFRKGDWNRYRIVCSGSDITLYVNATLMCRITDNNAGPEGRRGIIALQMHPGPPMKVQFKDLILKEIK